MIRYENVSFFVDIAGHLAELIGRARHETVAKDRESGGIESTTGGRT